MEEQLGDECQRQGRRHEVLDAGAIMLSPANIISYQLVDISQTGLAFLYHGDPIEEMAGQPATLNFFAEGFGAEDISVRVVSDHPFTEAREEDGLVTPPLRRCGVEFVALTVMQQDIVEKYIAVQGGE